MKLNAKQLRDLEHENDVILKKRFPVYLVLDNVYDTYNIGGLFRLADALAIEKLYICGESEIPPNTKIKRASIGTIIEGIKKQNLFVKEFEDGSCLVMATYKIEDLNQKFSWDIPEKQTTLGALISDEIDRIPSLGEVIKIDRYEMTIVSFFENSIGLIKVKKL